MEEARIGLTAAVNAIGEARIGLTAAVKAMEEARIVLAALGTPLQASWTASART